jgi:ABC-type amino acid transport substrate-binding protein
MWAMPSLMWVTLLLAAAAPRAHAETNPTGALRVLVVIDSDRPDFFAVGPAARPGFERELLAGFAHRRKQKLEVVPIATWEGVIPALLQGRGDVIAGHVTDTEERRKQVDFTEGVLPTRTVVITRRPHAPIEDMRALQEARVAAVRGTASHETVLAAGLPRAHIEETLTEEDMLEKLRTGKVDAAVRAAPLAILSQRDDPELQLGMFLGTPSSFAWGVRKNDTALRQALNDHIADVRRTGAWSRFVVQYFGDSAPAILKKAQER